MSANRSALMAPSFALSLFLFLFFLPQVRPERFLVSRLGSLSLSFSLSVAHTRGCSSSRLVPPPAIKVARGAHVGSALRGGERPRLMCNKSEQVLLIRWDPGSPGREPQQRRVLSGGEVAANLLGGRKLQMEASWKRILISVMGHQWALWGAKGAAENWREDEKEKMLMNRIIFLSLLLSNII